MAKLIIILCCQLLTVLLIKYIKVNLFLKLLPLMCSFLWLSAEYLHLILLEIAFLKRPNFKKDIICLKLVLTS